MRHLFRIAALLCLPAWALANPMGGNPARELPAGEYLCSMGSYRYKPCTIEHTDGKVLIEVREGARFPFKAELWPTDHKKTIVLDGRLTNPHALCPTCPDDKVGTECPGTVAEKRACHAQTLRAELKLQKNGAWVGKLHHYLLRGTWERGGKLTGHYRLGLTAQFRIWKRLARTKGRKTRK